MPPPAVKSAKSVADPVPVCLFCRRPASPATDGLQQFTVRGGRRVSVCGPCWADLCTGRNPRHRRKADA